MKKRLKEIVIKMKKQLEIVESLEIYNPSYELINKIREIELMIDKVNDLILWIEADQEF